MKAKDRELLTPKQAHVLTLIQVAWESFGHAPSQRWIAERIGKNISTVNQLVGELEAKGYITREKGKAYGIRLVETDEDKLGAMIFRDLRQAINGCFGSYDALPGCFQKKFNELEKRYTIPREE